MSLRSLQLRSFRNYRELDLPLGAEITVFTGSNGIGKTTILEAVSILGSGRSFRMGKNLDFISSKAEAGSVKGEIESQGLLTEIQAKIYPQGKKIFVDGKLIKTTEVLLNLLPTIVFSPADHKIIEGDSSDRKAFLNRAISNVDWEYLDELTHYNKALVQRNRILKDSANQSWNSASIQDLLAPWDEQLLEFGTRLMMRRFLYLAELRTSAEEEYRKISVGSDHFHMFYEPFGDESPVSFETDSELRKIYQKKFDDSLRRDLIVGSTQVGPHKDEILLTLNGNKVKFYGSQGEKRTCALALRLGELALFRAKQRRMPVLLFDDVSSELDKARRQSLVELLQKENTQVFITATELPSSLMGDVGKNFEHLDLTSVGERI